jgi:hypothetical protein
MDHSSPLAAKGRGDAAAPPVVVHPPAVGEPAWTRPALLLPAFGTVALVGGALPSFSLAATLLVLAVGGGLVWAGLSGRVPKAPAPRRLSGGAAWWLVPALLLCLVELVNFVLGSTHAHPTLSKLTDPWLASYPVKSASYFAWLTGFWGLVRR